MRFYQISVLYPAVVAGLVFCRPAEYPRTAVLDMRDLLGLLGDNGNAPPAAITPTPTTTQPATPITTLATEETRGSQLLTTRTEAPRTTFFSISAHGTATSSSATVIGTLTSHLMSATSSFSSASFTATGYVADESTTPPAELRQWKVIGIAVITVTFIAIIILAVSFFDSWWGFVCDAVCGKRRKQKYGTEDLVPDWGKRSWEFKLANEDGHRYPTLESLESIVKEKDKAQDIEIGRKGRISSHEMAYGGYQ